MSILPPIHNLHVIVESESLLLTLSRKMFGRNLYYESPQRRHRSTAFIFNFEHISHLLLVLLLLILNMCLIADFDISYFSCF